MVAVVIFASDFRVLNNDLELSTKKTATADVIYYRMNLCVTK